LRRFTGGPGPGDLKVLGVSHAAQPLRQARRALSHEHIVSNQSPRNVTPAGSSAYSKATTDEMRCEWRFPSDLTSMAGMRSGLRSFLDDTALSDDEIEDLVLAASEAANNAVEHAQQPTVPFFDVSAAVDDGAVTIVIQDHGGWRQPTSPSDRGRGLAMMRDLADTTVIARLHGTTVTMRSPRAAPAALAEDGRAS
jgi:anti-sigma regulatory factor (Ser/Thr protein kinase)